MRKKIGMALALVIATGSGLWASSIGAEVMRIATSYGLTEWERVEALRYTFNVQKGETTVRREWEWHPLTGDVTVQSTEGDKTMRVVYNRNKLDEGDTALNQKAEGWFINDQYWLLFPFHLVWDDTADTVFNGLQPLPMGTGKCKKLTVTYPAQGGFTPGDIYEIYYGPVQRPTVAMKPAAASTTWAEGGAIFQQWMYRRGGAEPGLATTWEGYQRLGPLVIATEHRNRAKKFHLWFSDLSVKLVNDAEWKQPGPVDSPKK
jgi:hypothetical protein